MPLGPPQSTVEMPLVSVVIAVRNGAATLQRCLDSIAAQDLASRETIVVDGASTDGTRELLERNLLAGVIDGYLSEPDRGVYDAWNKGIRRARGKWVCFLGCDDAFYEPAALRSLVEGSARADDPSSVVYGRVRRVTQSGALVETIGVPWEQARETFLAGVNIPHPGTLHLRSMLESHHYFDDSYRIAGDYHLLLGELPARPPLFVDRVVVNMGFGGLSSRPGTILVALREVERARKVRGLAKTPRQLQARLAYAWAGNLVHRAFGDRAYRRLADAYRQLRGRPKIWTA
jgi:glycosyltransferase involved in cell wall biosynthesis